jgi:hypothetical protein
MGPTKREALAPVGDLADANALGVLAEKRLLDGPAGFHQVFLFHARRRVGDDTGELAVIRIQDEPRRKEVQPPDMEESFLEGRSEE